MRRLIVTMVFAAAFAVSVHAQDVNEGAQCRSSINAAIERTNANCTSQGGSSACFGNPDVTVTYQQYLEDAIFGEVGDQIGLGLVETLTGSSLDSEFGKWGVLRLNTRLNLSHQAVTMYTFGEVEIRNSGDVAQNVPSIVLTVQAPQGANVRALPALDGRVIDQVFFDQTIVINGRTADSAWLRIQIPSGELGWMGRGAVNFVEAINSLEVVDSLDVGFAPMQSIELSTATDDLSQCRYQPPSGLLVQTPEDALAVTLLSVNSIDLFIDANSTLYLRDVDSGLLRISVFEGAVSFVVVENEYIVEPTEETIVISADETPLRTSYDYRLLSRLPLDEMPRPIVPALDFDTLIQSPIRPGADPLEDVSDTDVCTIGAVVAAANIRELPATNARVRRTMQIGESAVPEGRAQGFDGELWWRLAESVWVSSAAVSAVGDCGNVPVYPSP